MYSGFCTNCHEETYIEQQYIDEKTDIPNSIFLKSREHEKDKKRREKIRKSF